MALTASRRFLPTGMTSTGNMHLNSLRWMYQRIYHGGYGSGTWAGHLNGLRSRPDEWVVIYEDFSEAASADAVEKTAEYKHVKTIFKNLTRGKYNLTGNYYYYGGSKKKGSFEFQMFVVPLPHAIRGAIPSRNSNISEINYVISILGRWVNEDGSGLKPDTYAYEQLRPKPLVVPDDEEFSLEFDYCASCGHDRRFHHDAVKISDTEIHCLTNCSCAGFAAQDQPAKAQAAELAA